MTGPVKRKPLTKDEMERGRLTNVHTFTISDKAALGLKALSDVVAKNPPMGATLPLRLVVAGGMVALLELNSRNSTDDVDFALNAGQIDLENALQRLADTDPVRGLDNGDQLKRYWFNPAMSFYLNMKPYEGAYEESLKQGDILFRSESLVLYAAPWKCQLYRKLARVCKSIRSNMKVRNEDAQDAAYLIRRFQTQLGHDVRLDDIIGWYNDPGAKLERRGAETVAACYREMFHENWAY